MPINIPDESELAKPYEKPFEYLLDEPIPDEDFIAQFNELEAEGKLEFRTAPFDARFPNTNQTKNCWQNYVDFQRCIKAKGADYEPCQYFYKVYRSICPESWTDAWDERVSQGIFMPLGGDKKKSH